MGDSDRALEVLDNFRKKYPTESDFLMDWKQAQARIKRQSNKKRYCFITVFYTDRLTFILENTI